MFSYDKMMQTNPGAVQQYQYYHINDGSTLLEPSSLESNSAYSKICQSNDSVQYGLLQESDSAKASSDNSSTPNGLTSQQTGILFNNNAQLGQSGNDAGSHSTSSVNFESFGESDGHASDGYQSPEAVGTVDQGTESTEKKTPSVQDSLPDIMAASIINSLQDCALYNPTYLLLRLLGFDASDYHELQVALQDSGYSFVDIISSYLHNLKTVSEDQMTNSACLNDSMHEALIAKYLELMQEVQKLKQTLIASSSTPLPTNQFGLLQQQIQGQQPFAVPAGQVHQVSHPSALHTGQVAAQAQQQALAALNRKMQLQPGLQNLQPNQSIQNLQSALQTQLAQIPPMQHAGMFDKQANYFGTDCYSQQPSQTDLLQQLFGNNQQALRAQIPQVPQQQSFAQQYQLNPYAVMQGSLIR